MMTGKKASAIVAIVVSVTVVMVIVLVFMLPRTPTANPVPDYTKQGSQSFVVSGCDADPDNTNARHDIYLGEATGKYRVHIQLTVAGDPVDAYLGDSGITKRLWQDVTSLSDSFSPSDANSGYDITLFDYSIRVIISTQIGVPCVDIHSDVSLVWSISLS